MRSRLAAIAVAASVAAFAPSAAQAAIWLTAPADGAVASRGAPVTFEFGTDWVTGVFPGRLGLQVARDTGFTDLVVEDVFTCPASFTPSCPSSAVRGPFADGMYHWRVRWYSTPDGQPPTWVPSDTWSFSVGAAPAAGNAAPTARFVFTPAAPAAGERVDFDGSGSTDADGAITSYAWSFGNGNGAAGSPFVGTTFASAGTYTVTLTVTDDGGATAAADVTVTVAAPAAPDVEPAPAPPAPATASESPPAPPPADTVAQPLTVARDTKAPSLRALESSGRRGATVRLRLRVADDSGSAVVSAIVRAGRRTVATLRANVAAHSFPPVSLLWRGARRPQPFTFCVRAADAAGNTSKQSCAAVRLR